MSCNPKKTHQAGIFVVVVVVVVLFFLRFAVEITLFPCRKKTFLKMNILGKG